MNTHKKIISMTNVELKELMNVVMTGIRAEIKAGNDMINYKMDELIQYQKIQNGRTQKLEEETKVWRLIHRNPKASIMLILLIVAGLFVLWPYAINAIF